MKETKSSSMHWGPGIWGWWAERACRDSSCVSALNRKMRPQTYERLELNQETDTLQPLCLCKEGKSVIHQHGPSCERMAYVNLQGQKSSEEPNPTHRCAGCNKVRTVTRLAHIEAEATGVRPRSPRVLESRRGTFLLPRAAWFSG